MRRRPATGAGAAWVFGLATTIFMIAVWGRAVVIDVDGIGEAAAPMAESDAIVDLFTEWLEAEIVQSGVDPTTSQLVVEDVLAQASVTEAFGEFVGDFVAAAAVPTPAGSIVDIASILYPTVPEIEGALKAAGLEVDRAQITDLVSELDPLVVRGPGAPPYIGPTSPTAGRLGTAAVLALMVMCVSGWIAVAASEDRIKTARGLLNRVALGGLSFAIILKAGSWVLDPEGGRAPLTEALSILADAQWLIPLAVAAMAAATGTLIWAVRRSIRREGGTPSQDEMPTPPEGLQLTRSG